MSIANSLRRRTCDCSLRPFVNRPPGADKSDDDVQHASKKIRVDSGKDECVVPQTASICFIFKSNDEVYKSLCHCAPQDVLPEVPRGKKVNCSFIINNVDNVQRKSSQQCNRFWDDCAVWDRQKGRNLTLTFVLLRATNDCFNCLSFTVNVCGVTVHLGDLKACSQHQRQRTTDT